MKKILFAMGFFACLVTGCAQKQQKQEEQAQKVLVLYYSQNGATQAVAEELQKQLGADIERIEAEEPYAGDFQATIQRSGQEREKGETPALKPLQSKIADYDVIFLGYPYRYPRQRTGFCRQDRCTFLHLWQWRSEHFF